MNSLIEIPEENNGLPVRFRFEAPWAKEGYVIPVGATRKRGKKYFFPFTLLEIGEAVYIPCVKALSRVQVACMAFAQYNERKFKTRRVWLQDRPTLYVERVA